MIDIKHSGFSESNHSISVLLPLSVHSLYIEDALISVLSDVCPLTSLPIRCEAQQ